MELTEEEIIFLKNVAGNNIKMDSSLRGEMIMCTPLWLPFAPPGTMLRIH